MNAAELKQLTQQVKDGQRIRVSAVGKMLLDASYPELKALNMDLGQELAHYIHLYAGKRIKIMLGTTLFKEFIADPSLLNYQPQQTALNGADEPEQPLKPISASNSVSAPSQLPTRPPEDINSFQADFYRFQYQNACSEIDRLRHENMQLHSENIGLMREKATWEGKREIEVLLAKSEGKKGLAGLTDPGVLEGIGSLLEKAAIALATIREKEKQQQRNSSGNTEGMDGTAATYATQIVEELKTWVADDIYKLAFVTEFFTTNKRALDNIFKKVQAKVNQQDA